MKARELMLGDAVTHNGDIFRVVSLDFYGGLVGVDNIDTCEMVADEELSPLELTEDILLTNGFSLIKEKPVRTYRRMLGEYLEDGFLQVAFHNFESGKEIAFHIENSLSETPTDLMVVVKYVHEMQNALRLSGLYEIADDIK